MAEQNRISIDQCSSTVRTVRTGAYEQKKVRTRKVVRTKVRTSKNSAYEKNGAYKQLCIAMAHQIKAVSTV